MAKLPVALYTSAWIEISRKQRDGVLVYVALYTSAWIEITLVIQNHSTSKSHSTRVRGLKYHKPASVQADDHVALYTSAWIEMIDRGLFWAAYQCRTLHECVD